MGAPDAERQEPIATALSSLLHDICAIMQSRLNIPVIEDHVHLGCSAEERRYPHRVHYAVEIVFSTMPQACTSDLLDKTPCYAEISAALLQNSKEKHFATIEHLAHTSFLTLEKYIRAFSDLKPRELELTIHKLNPPVASIKAGSLFTLRQAYTP